MDRVRSHELKRGSRSTSPPRLRKRQRKIDLVTTVTEDSEKPVETGIPYTAGAAWT